MVGWVVLIISGLGLAWGAVGNYRHEEWLLSVFVGRGPVVRTVLPFAVVTVTAAALLFVAAGSAVDERPALSTILLAVLAAGILVMMPLIMMCLPTQSSAYGSLRRDLQKAGLERGAALALLAVMAPWALLMLMS